MIFSDVVLGKRDLTQELELDEVEEEAFDPDDEPDELDVLDELDEFVEGELLPLSLLLDELSPLAFPSELPLLSD